MFKMLSALLVAAVLSGCAGMNNLTSEVSTYSEWPAGQKPGTYAFERLPSQQAQADRQKKLEDAARHALEVAGFTPAAEPGAADFTVQLGARVSLSERPVFDDPFWWHGGVYRYYPYRARPYRGYYLVPGMTWRYDSGSYEREVALLIRDRKSGVVVYEAHAVNDGISPTIDSLLVAMFDATLKDFPEGGTNPRNITTPLAP